MPSTERDRSMSFYERDSGAARIAVAYDERLVPWLFAHWVDPLLGIAVVQPSDHVVDLACGTGLVTRALVDRLDADGHVHGVDLDEVMLARAATAVNSRQVTWQKADAGDLPLETSTFDLVVCNQGLQFFPDRDVVLAEVRRILRPGGRLALAVWGRLEANPWPAAMAEAIGEFLGDDARAGTESVCGLGDPDRVRSLLTGAGFMDVDVSEMVQTARHSDVRDAIDGQLAAVPFAGSIDALGPQRRRALIEFVANLLADYIAPNGMLQVPSSSVLAAATVPH
jgi:SAM-dependent methyltransferase